MQKILLILTALALAGCTQANTAWQASAWATAQPPEQRDQLTATELLAPATQRTTPVDNAYLMPIGQPAPARHELEGTLSVPEFRMSYTRGAQDAAFITSAPAYFPGFTVSFYTCAGYLVPVSREELLPPGKNSAWSLILSPGKTWSEPGDGGLSRASFPFALVASSSNETHNGVATFLYNDQRATAIYLQITQETAAWQKTDFWGQAALQYTPGPVIGKQALAARLAGELDQQLPILPWSDLEAKYPALTLEAFSGGLDPAEISATGLVLEGKIYMPPCQTRFGEFPYRRAMRHGSFSVSKSMGAAIALLRLAEKFGEGVFDLKIIDYVQPPSTAADWSPVTFGDALNMSTGIGSGPAWKLAPNLMMVDEYTQQFNDFSQAKSAAEKLKVAFSYGEYPWGPGEVARYNSSTLFILSAAMNGYLQSVAGPQADIWEMVLEEVYNPIGIWYAPVMRTSEPDGSPGLPVLAYGLYPTAEELARIAILLQNGGRYGGQQILHAGRLAEALRRTDNHGLPTGDRTRYGDTTYLMSFWADAYKTGSGRYFLIPYMTGYGGNRLVLAPNGVSSFRFTDAMNYDTLPLIRAAEKIRPFPGPGIPVSRLILLRGLWLVPKNPVYMQVIDFILLAWLLLALAAILLYGWDVVHGKVPTWGMRFFWCLALIVAGPLAGLVYILAYRRPRRAPDPKTALTRPIRALGSALISTLGYALGIWFTGFLLETYLTGSRRTLLTVLACSYGLPLGISLLGLRLPLTYRLSSRGLFAALGSAALVELISLNTGMLVLLPLISTAYNRFPLPNPAALAGFSQWLFFLFPWLLATVAGWLVILPVHTWTMHAGLSHWLLPGQAVKVSWRQVLIAAAASLAVLLVALLITQAAASY